MTVTLRLRASGGATSSVVLSDPAVTGTARGLITAFNPASDNWQNPERNIIDGQQWFAENANKAWSLTKTDNYTFRVEVRPNDLWADDGTSRSELQSARTIPVGSEFSTEFYFTVEPGVMGSMAWRGVAQIHDGSPFVSLSIHNDIINVLINQTGGGGDPSLEKTIPLQRGHRYKARIQLRKSQSSNGYLKVFIDDVQIIQYDGVLGSGSGGGSLKIGVYQGWPENLKSPIAVVYDHLALDFVAPPPPPPPPPLPPGLAKVGESAVLTTGDNGNAGLICAQKVTLPTAARLQSLSFYLATASGNLRLGLYTDAGTKPGTKITEAASAAAVSGWNTRAVTPVNLAAGNYWLAYEVSSNSAAFRKGSGGSLVVAPVTFGTMPATFPNPTGSEAVHWSFYMTVNVA